MARSRRARGQFGEPLSFNVTEDNLLHFTDDERDRRIQLQGRYRWLRIMLGAHICSASLPETEKSIWEHYNELVAELDAKQVEIWHDMADTTLLFVRAHSLYTFPCS